MTTMSKFAAPGSWHLKRRLYAYKVPKTVALLACVTCIAATVVVGFTWGGWITGTAAAAISDQAARSGQAKLAASICVDRFITGPHAGAQTALLLGTDSAGRSEFIKQGGWLVLPGMTEPVAGAAELCVSRIMNTALISN